MSDVSLPTVVPPVVLADRAARQPRNSAAPFSARPPLPLMALSDKRAGSAVYGFSTLDAGGRVADRVIMAALGWVPGGRLDIRVSRGLIAVFRDDRGIFRVTAQGFLRLPVAAPRWCEVSTGDRVLLAAYPEGDLLVVHPPAAREAVVDRVHAEALGAGIDG
ncbi:hypothetical protein ACQP2F_18030 [Actinoplanes sp. CA-030573]|uniref:hypothetical protein n=1 Tax=Actinoplanes sp. CA-030573 TaxID=3239898 RepID=UPI003D8BFEC9